MRIDEAPKASEGGTNDGNGRSSAEFHPGSSLTRSRSGLAQRRENEMEKVRRVWVMASETPPIIQEIQGKPVKFQTFGRNRPG